MRIIYFTDTYLPEVNGAATSIDAHSRLLGEHGHEVLIICPKYRKPILHVVPHVQIKRYRSFSFISNKDTRIAVPYVGEVARTIRHFQPDVVHIHTPLSIGVIGLAAARQMKLPIIETYHTYIPDFMQYVELHRLLRLDDLQDRVTNSHIFQQMFEAGMFHAFTRLEQGGRRVVEDVTQLAERVTGGLLPEDREEFSSRVAWQFTRTIYNRADLVLTPSVTLKHELEENGITAPVEFLSNGIDTTLVAPKSDYSPKGRLLHVGRLGHEKNVDVVVDAFARVLQKLPGLKLDIIGDGPAMDNLRRQVERLGLQESVRFPGFMDRHALGKVYRDYDAFVTASTIETQGIVLLEAMSAGLPVVGVDALAVPELVKDDRNGIIVPPGDPDAFASAVITVMGDQEMRERMGQACREDVVAHALPSVVSRLEEIYAEVIAAKR